jgi:hypothetical protein
MQPNAARVTVIPAYTRPSNTGPVGLASKKRVAAYARVSTDSEEQLTSYEAQVDYYTRYIKEKDEWSFVEVYTEIIVPYMIRLRFRDFVKECKNLLIYRLSHTEGCAKVLFFCPLFSTDYFERVQLSVHDGNFAHPYNDEAVP